MMEVELISFLKHIKSKNFFEIKKRILVAVSGGIDSMVLLHLMQQTDYQIAVAHIDHNTRSGESTQDALFVEKYCCENNIDFHKSDFRDGNPNKGNFHQKAHSFRYAFFQSLGYDYIITAHHKDDNIESIFLNFINGKTNKGIPENNGNIIRPLLAFKKSEIIKYAQTNAVPYKEDASNNNDNYDRNFIRNKVIPLLQKQFNNIEEKLINNTKRGQADQKLLDKLVADKVQIDSSNFPIIIFKSLLNNNSQLLYHRIKDFGFNRHQAKDMVSALDNIGSLFHADVYTLLVDRDALIITEKNDLIADIEYVDLEKLPVTLKYLENKVAFEQVVKIGDESNNICYFPMRLLDKKLMIRTWNHGDHFCPLGMNGKHKTLKKFFADSKIDRITKQKIPILLSDGEIMWICGIRSDERFRYNDSDAEFLKVTLSF